MSRKIKKNPSYVVSLGLCSYAQQAMKTSSLGWFIDWQELESQVTAGLAISSCVSVCVESDFQHEGQRKAFVKQAAPLAQELGGQGEHCSSSASEGQDCASNKHNLGLLRG